jgi:hypothetical protein
MEQQVKVFLLLQADVMPLIIENENISRFDDTFSDQETCGI